MSAPYIGWSYIQLTLLRTRMRIVLTQVIEFLLKVHDVILHSRLP